MKKKGVIIVAVGQFFVASIAMAVEYGAIIGKQPFGCSDQKRYQTLLMFAQRGDHAELDKGIAAAAITGDCYKFGLNEAVEIIARDVRANLIKVHPVKLPKLPGKNEFFTTASQVIVKK